MSHFNTVLPAKTALHTPVAPAAHSVWIWTEQTQALAQLLHQFDSNIFNPALLSSISTPNQITAINMFGYKFFAFAVLALAVAATECSYAPPPSVGPGSHPPAHTTSLIQPLPEQPTSPVAPSGPAASSEAPAAPPASGTTTLVVPSPSESVGSATTTLEVPLSSAEPSEPSSSGDPSSVSTAAAAFATPIVGMGSLVAMGAVALAVAV
ncbi:hypothetical protein GMOD_00000217 [Pyrenophora seminiperda CCB06]|uniref:Uncharacterized protein n=1 Tax=Pyrenophora seminiperda CCB06 TaxID=1302712 RepID=A0A3M7M6Y3_9PLEO|nr:hypothetical protein GMOD_00000217 [Pyrenophora seminiperda CCB06]